MHIEEFKLERTQSLWENTVDFNLTESGLHPYTLKELLTPAELDKVLDLSLGYGWTNGMPSARAAVANLYSDRDENNVLITNGSAEANFVMTWCLIEPGDEVVMMLPNYMQIPGIAKSQGAKITPYLLREENRWQPDIDELKRLVTPATKLISITHPNNPTGAVFGDDIIRAMVDIASEVGAYIHCDEIYRGSELNGEESVSVADLGYDKAIVTAGLSKALALPGLRIGWLVGPKDFIQRAWHHNDYTTITTCIISEKAAEFILEPRRRQIILARSRKILNENLDKFTHWLKPRSGAFRFVPPQGGGMAFMGYNHPIGSTKLADYLRKKKSVFVVPGDCYGMDNFIRIGIGTEHKVLTTGLALMSEALDEIGFA